MEASIDEAENSRLVNAYRPKPKSKASPAQHQPQPELGDDGFPRDMPADDHHSDVPDLTSGLTGAGGHTNSAAGGGGADDEPDLEAQEHAVRKEQNDKLDGVLRRGFLRKVYGILTAQMLATVLVCGLITLSDPIREFVVTHALGLQLICIVPLLVLVFSLMAYKNEFPTNMYLLSAFTLVEAINLGTLCAVVYQSGGGKAILLATLLTAIAFVGLTLFTMQSQIDFSFLGAGLFTMLWVLLIGSLLSMAFGWHAQLPLALLGTAVFCGYIIFDTYLVTKRLGYDDYVVAAIELYLDLVNLFVYILRIVLSFMKKD